MFESSGFVHLDVRSNFSLKDGAFFPEELASRAAALGMPAVAITDRDGLYGAARFVDACAKSGIRPILGATLTIEGNGARVGRTARAGGMRRAQRAESAERPPRRRPPEVARPTTASVVVLAEDRAGYANLCRLVTDAHMLGERGDPQLAVEQLLAHSQGLICLLGPRSPVGTLAVSGLHDAAVEALSPFREAFGDRLHVEMQNRLERDSRTEIRRLLRLADETHTSAVATNAVRYLVREDAFLADALECMREIVPVSETNVGRTNAEGWLKPASHMRRLFAERPELCDATLQIAERCEFDLGLRGVHFPDFPTPPGRSAASVLAERCRRGVERRYVKPTREVRERLDHELAMIQRLGYAAYFLTVADIVADVRSIGIRTACRGSAAGSLVCYLTGISDVDPIRHGLLFERFLNPLRDELPDIDIDVESARREDVYDLVLSRHGDDRCACVAMVETYRARAAIREVGKALAMPDLEIDVVAKAFPHIGAHGIREAIERLPELRGTNVGRGQLELLFRVAERLNGFPRHLALHPSGIVLAGHDLVERVPLERSFQGYRMIQADKDDVELLGYLKLDVLGVRLLSSMRHAVEEIARTAHEKVDLDAIPVDDGATFDLIRSSDTLGCFQIESPGQRELLQKLQPDVWEDLIVEISLFRPGPVKSDMVTPYVNRRHGYEPPSYTHPDLRAVLGETFGVIVYHEQVMRTFAVLAGYDLSEADRIRRHLDADPFEVEEIREDFLRRVRERGMPPEEAERIWHSLFSFASFGFCKAHAAAFAVPTYQSSWLKAHWPAHFLAGVLTHEPGMYPRRLILDDARRHGIPILPLGVNTSERYYTVEVVKGPAEVGADSAERFPRSASPRSVHMFRSVDPLPAGPGAVPPSRAASGQGDASGHSLPSGSRLPRPATSVARGSAPNGTVYGIRLGLKDVHGISDGEVRAILEARAERTFRDVGDFVRRAAVSRPVVERLAHAGAFDSLDSLDSPRSGTRRDRLYAAMVTEPMREGDQLTLGLYAGEGPLAESGGSGGVYGRAGPSPERGLGGDWPAEEAALPPPAQLREYTDAERVRAELEVIEMDASRHVMSFYEPLLASLDVVRARDLWKLRGGQRVTVAGVKVSTQTPAVRSGQRIIFLTLDDATGPVDVTVFESVQPRCARTIFHSFALAVRGTVRRTGVRGVSIVAEDVRDLAALQRVRSGAREAAMPRGRLWHASGGSAG